MARKPRIHFDGALYHVMVRGNLGEPIFHTNLDRKYFYSLLEESIDRFSCSIHAFCLMGNHVHLALQVNDISLSKIMHNITFRYAQWINKNINRKGHLFQGRYKAILVDSDNYLLELVRYIHLNPIRANIVKNINDYEWSSNLVYLGKEKLDWLKKDFVLSCISKDKSVAIKNYCLFMEKLEHEGDIKKFRTGNQKGQLILGTNDFISKISKLPKLSTKNNKLSLQEVINFVADYYSVNVESLNDKSKCRLNSTARSMIGLLAKNLNIQTSTKVAKHFGRDLSSFLHAMRKLNSLPSTALEVKTLSCELEMSESP